MIGYIDAHRADFGVEPICRVLAQAGVAIAPSTYYAANTRPPSARSLRDEWLKTEITWVFDANYRVYGADKVWVQLHRQGIGVARCTVERLMRQLDLRGAVPGKVKQTTICDRRDPASGPGQGPVPGSGAQPPMGGRPDVSAHEVSMSPMCRCRETGDAATRSTFQSDST